jgi:hypothetical protein
LQAIPPLEDFFTHANGLYLLPEIVPGDGTITEIGALGFVTDRQYEIFMRNELSQFLFTGYLLLVVFRLNTVNGLFQLIHGPEFLYHTVNTPGSVRPDWPVMKGDRIGALIPDSCLNDTDAIPFPCPSHINLRVAPSDCLSGLYYPLVADYEDMDLAEQLASIPANQFIEEQILVNLEAEISLATGMFNCLPHTYMTEWSNYRWGIFHRQQGRIQDFNKGGYAHFPHSFGGRAAF